MNTYTVHTLILSHSARDADTSTDVSAKNLFKNDYLSNSANNKHNRFVSLRNQGTVTNIHSFYIQLLIMFIYQEGQGI